MPSRTIWWSSANRTCTGISLLQRYLDVQFGSLTRRRLNVTSAAENLQALAYAEQPKSPGDLAGCDRALVEPGSVVFDRTADKALNLPETDFCGAGACMFRRILQRFLNHPVKNHLDSRRQ